MLRENENGGARVPLPDFSRRARALIAVLGWHAHVDDGEIRLVLGDDGQQGLGIAHPRDDLVPASSRSPASLSGRTVSSAITIHGISTSIRVPAPRGLWMRSVRPGPRPGRSDPEPGSLCHRRATHAIVGHHEAQGSVRDHRFDANA